MTSLHGSLSDSVNGSTAHASDAALRTRAVSMVYRRDGGEFHALQSVDLTIRDGEFVALVGPSGCGKSTLLRVLAGLTTPTTGEVSVYGEPVVGARRDVSLMFQKSTLFPWRTALKNVLLPVEVERRARPADVKRAEELLDLVQLGSFKNHYQKELSGGMQQRVALARLLMLDPKVMLLDEPFGALDEFTRETLNEQLASIISAERRTGILVTHNIAESIFLADRVVAMNTAPGRIVGEVVVDEPRPRPLSFTRSQAFQDLTIGVRQLLGLE